MVPAAVDEIVLEDDTVVNSKSYPAPENSAQAPLESSALSWK